MVDSTLCVSLLGSVVLWFTSDSVMCSVLVMLAVSGTVCFSYQSVHVCIHLILICNSLFCLLRLI